MSSPRPGWSPGEPYRGGARPAGPNRGSSGPPRGGSYERGWSPGGPQYERGRAPGGPPPDDRDRDRAPRGPRGPRAAIRLDPVIVESVIGVAWLTVGTLGLGAGGAGTLVLAAGIALVVYIFVENRRRGSRAFDPPRSVDLLRYGAVAVGAIVVASVLLGLISVPEFGPPLAAAVTGGAFLALARSTGQRPTQWLGIALVALGVLAGLVATQSSSGVVSQGVLGLLCGVLVLLSAADRIGLLETLRDRIR